MKANCKQTCTFVDNQSEVQHFDDLLEHWNTQRSKLHNLQRTVAATNNKGKQKATKKEKRKTPEQASAITNSTDKTYTEHMFKKGEKPKEWTKEKHKDWCNSNNTVITHFGIDPRKFPRSRIHFDVFHMVKNLLVLILDQLVKFTANQSLKFQNKLEKTLRT